jgi:polyhydroxyalkanoate synthase
MTKASDEHYMDAASWEATAPHRSGSWWPQWVSWLEQRSGAPVASPSIGAAAAGYAPLADAPGRYVLEQ